MDTDQLIKSVTEAVVRQLKIKKPAVIPLAVSNRHVHLSGDDIKRLFGSGQLTAAKELSQLGQVAYEEKVILAGPKGVIEKVRVLGPARAQSQVELALSDCRRLGIKPPVRDSGDLKGSAGITLVGPVGAITLTEGVIVAARHIHMTQSDAVRLRLGNGDRVCVRTNGIRGVVFNETLIRVSPDYRLEMHIDVDEANAAGLNDGDSVEIIYRRRLDA